MSGDVARLHDEGPDQAVVAVVADVGHVLQVADLARPLGVARGREILVGVPPVLAPIDVTVTQAGVPAPRIVETSYQTASSAPAPIRLSYVATTAMTNQCGQWPEDIANNTMSNENWYNFGCASQNNLAAQLDNPMDLVAPRAMTPIDAQNRSKVIQTYRGQDKKSN